MRRTTVDDNNVDKTESDNKMENNDNNEKKIGIEKFNVRMDNLNQKECNYNDDDVNKKECKDSSQSTTATQRYQLTTTNFDRLR